MLEITTYTFIGNINIKKIYNLLPSNGENVYQKHTSTTAYYKCHLLIIKTCCYLAHKEKVLNNNLDLEKQFLSNTNYRLMLITKISDKKFY